MDEDVVVELPGEGLRSAVRQLGRLVEQHLSGLEGDAVHGALVVADDEGPRAAAAVRHVDDDADDVRVHPVEVRGQPAARGVAADAVHGGAQEPRPRPLLRQGVQRLQDGVLATVERTKSISLISVNLLTINF